MKQPCGACVDYDGAICDWCKRHDFKAFRGIETLTQSTPVVTNYDLIISKTPYELAEWIGKILTYCENKMLYDLCSQNCPLYKCCNDQPSDNIEDWLKSPVEEQE